MNSPRLDLDSIIAGTTFLPPAFELIPRLLLILDDEDASTDDLANIIHADAGLTASVLRLANSAYFGGGRKTNSLSEAIIRIGAREIYRAVLRIIATPALSKENAFGRQPVELWPHSLATAVGAQCLARKLTQEDPEVVFTAALLHDIGKVVIATAAGGAYYDLLKRAAEKCEPVYMAERAAFQTDHMEVACRLLERWSFPERIIRAIGGHHDPVSAGESHAQVASLVYAGNVLAYRVGQGYGNPMYSVHPEAGALQLINLKPDDVTSYEEHVTETVRQELRKLC